MTIATYSRRLFAAPTPGVEPRPARGATRISAAPVDADRVADEIRAIGTGRANDQARLVGMRDRMRRALEQRNPGAGRIGWWIDLDGLPGFSATSTRVILTAALAGLPNPHAALELAGAAELIRYGHRLGDIAELAEVLTIRAAARRNGRSA